MRKSVAAKTATAATVPTPLNITKNLNKVNDLNPEESVHVSDGRLSRLVYSLEKEYW